MGDPRAAALKHVSSSNTSNNTDATTLIILVACSAGIALMLIVLGLFVIFKCKKPPSSLLAHDRHANTAIKTGYSTKFPTVPLHQTTPPSAHPDFHVDVANADYSASSVVLQPSPDHLLHTAAPHHGSRYQRVGSRSSSWSGYPSTEQTEESETEADSCGGETPRGKIWLTATYNQHAGELNVTLIKAKYYLIGSSRHSFPKEPFINLYLLPDEHHYLTSQSHGRSLNPRFNESFQFQLQEEDIGTRTLRVSVYDMDKKRVRRTLGHALLPLSRINLSSGEIISKELFRASQVTISGGEIQVALCYMPFANRLKLTILCVKNLLTLHNEIPDSYVKVQLFEGGKLIKSKKTNVARATLSPVFHEMFTFNISGHLLDTLSVTLILVTSPPSNTSRLSYSSSHSHQSSVDSAEAGPSTSSPATLHALPASSSSIDRPSYSAVSHKKKTYWKVTIGSFMFARGNQLVHWQEMVSHPRQAVTKWHKLTPF